MKEHNTMTAGMDIGDKFCVICLLDDQGEVVERVRITSTAHSLTRYFNKPEPLRVALEAGGHSPWMSRLLKKLGHEVIVANPRRLALITKNKNKSDQDDAELLARLARSDPRLLSPIEHRRPEHQQHLAVVRARDVLVRSRTMLVNHVRGVVKSFGGRLPRTATSRFHKLTELVPAELAVALEPLMATLRDLNTRIAELDRVVEQLCDEQYPDTALLREVPGLGPLTALVFVLTIGNPQRFARNRDVGAYLGLTPRKRQSGGADPELHITHEGNTYLRRLLINATHYILGPFGPDTELRRFGLKLAARGGKAAKKRAVVAVARKLAVLSNMLWKNGEIYEPFPGTRAEKCGAPVPADHAPDAQPSAGAL